MKIQKKIYNKGEWNQITVWTNQSGEYHREDGPAVLRFASFTKEWWIEGKNFSNEDEFKKEIYKRNLQKLNETN